MPLQVERAAPTSPDRIRAVVEAMENFELSESSAWGDLDSLSSQTFVDGIEVDPAGVILDGSEKFHGIFSIYLLLKYGGKSDEGFETSESFLGRFSGHFKKDEPVIDEISVDTSPFFEGETEEG